MRKEKRCTECDSLRTIGYFGKRKNSPDGHQDMCRECVLSRRAKIKRLREVMGYADKDLYAHHQRMAKYGLDQETYELMLQRQHHICAICGEFERLVVDHDHKLEEYGVMAVRGLLCQRCNIGLGAFRDDPEILKDAIRYLKSFGNY